MFDILLKFLRRCSLTWVRNRVALHRRDSAFDRDHGVDTGGIIHPGKEDVRSGNWRHGSRYQAIDPEAFSEALECLRIRHAETVFIDLGSGKGRAVLLAASYPFKRIIGVEYSESLHEIAQGNVERRSRFAKCQDIQLLCMDAAQFSPPRDPLLVFLYNPFDGEVMSRVVEQFAASFREAPRPIAIVYFNPAHLQAWEQSGFLDRVRPSPWNTAIFETPRTALGSPPARATSSGNGSAGLSL